MGLFDQIKSKVTSAIRQEIREGLDDAGDKALEAMKKIGKGITSSKSFKFDKLPMNVDDLKAYPEASLDTAFKTTALTILALTRYEQDPEAVHAMLDFLKGPDDTSKMEEQFLSDRLKGKGYKVMSFFDGATVENDYKPKTPYKITVYENPYSFDEENRAILYVQSGGSDSQRPIKLRKKPSTCQWFVTEILCLEDIKTPKSEDPWA